MACWCTFVAETSAVAEVAVPLPQKAWPGYPKIGVSGWTLVGSCFRTVMLNRHLSTNFQGKEGGR